MNAELRRWGREEVPLLLKTALDKAQKAGFMALLAIDPQAK